MNVGAKLYKVNQEISKLEGEVVLSIKELGSIENSTTPELNGDKRKKELEKEILGKRRKINRLRKKHRRLTKKYGD